MELTARLTRGHASQRRLGVLLSVGLALSSASCAKDPDIVDLGGPAQLVRQRVMEDFANNPVWARRKYSSLFEDADVGERNELVARIAACSSVESSGLPLYFPCRDFISQQLASEDAEIRGMAVATLMYRTDSESIRLLLAGYDELDDRIHMPAASALQGRLDSLRGSASSAEIVELGKKIQPHCRARDSSIGQKLCAEVAETLRH
jgi:hypothetical protein